jgi:hypothetical protein
MSRALGPLIILILCLTSCFERTTKSSHGLSFIPRTQFSYRGAVDRSIKLKFNVEKSDISEITAMAQLPENYEGDIKFKWFLGEGVLLEEGLLENKIVNLKKSKVVAQIKVKGFTKEFLRHIRFEIHSDNSKRKIFADGIVSSQQENSFEEIVKEIENYKKENLNDK